MKQVCTFPMPCRFQEPQVGNDYSHNEGLPPITDESRVELKKAFDIWFTRILLLDGSSALERDVLRNQKMNLFEEWLRVRPHLTQDEADFMNRKKK
jgi:hypothetical protein